MNLTQAVKAEAKHLGFDLCGITTPDPPLHVSTFEAWLQAGRQGRMDYLATERSRLRRADPRQILPECRSILVLGVRYPASQVEMPLEQGEPRGRVASYALGKDYHQVLPERLQALVSFIEGKADSPVPNRWYTDTGPILERDLAQRAGLGWIGKNTCLIDPNRGSYYLLAEILLGIDLDPDPPFIEDRCGSCTRCLEACPTSCILPDRTIDAQRCISYLTIELKDAIPLELRSDVGEWAFGCDVCQQVCPWNQRFAKPEGDPEFAPRLDLPFPDLIREVSLTTEEFNRKFKDSPVKRAKRRGYLRNVAVALGNRLAGSGDERAVAALKRVLQAESEPLVRRHAAWAIGRIGGRAARQALEDATITEMDPEVLEEIQHAIEEA
jgi:epoxyqueuosine reductase